MFFKGSRLWIEAIFANIQNCLIFWILGGHKDRLRHDWYFFFHFAFLVKKGTFFYYILLLEWYKNFKNATFASLTTSPLLSLFFPAVFCMKQLEYGSRPHKYRVGHYICFFNFNWIFAKKWAMVFNHIPLLEALKIKKKTFLDFINTH